MTNAMADDLRRLMVPSLASIILGGAVTGTSCLDRAIANQLDPDPPPPQDAALDVTCTEAVTTVFRDGCCNLRNDLCGGSTQSCDADPTTEGSSGAGNLDSTGGDSTEGLVPSLEPFYAEVSCEGTTCTIGQPLIDALLRSPEAVLAEGTSLAFVSSQGAVIGMELRGVEATNLAGRLGLRDGDVLTRVGSLPVRNEAELFAAAEWAMRTHDLTVALLRDERSLLRRFVREPW
jgi:hypothetical protein